MASACRGKADQRPRRWRVLWIVLLLPAATVATDRVYKSVDESGNVTYSAEPPADATTVEALDLPAEPSEEATRQALDRAQELEQEADARYDAIMARRQREAEARADAEQKARAAEQAGRAGDSSEATDSTTTGYIWYRPHWVGPRPPRPPRPPWPPQPRPRPGDR